MVLSDNDKRDIIKLLEHGQPLPDKYRFLLFADKREVELVWNGKTSEVCNIVLPLQTIEEIDEPREEKTLKLQTELFDNRGRQVSDWTNKLIWGDNKLILSSLKNGPLRQEIEDNGGIKLIYIDPPFDVGADFSMDIEIGDEQFTKQPTVLEELAYRDTWGKGADSFIAMVHERLSLMRDLLADDGSIYVHCDYRVSAYLKMVLDEIFGNKFINEIIWTYEDIGSRANDHLKRKHDTIYLYSKTENRIFNKLRKRLADSTIKRFEKYFDGEGKISYQQLKNTNPGVFKKLKGIPENLNEIWLDINAGPTLNDWWTDISPLKVGFSEQVGYPTQKPETLLERIIQLSSNENDIVADFFCGSGTTLAVAEKLGRKWIGTDLGKFANHTTRKRLIGVQRELKEKGQNFRPFEILNMGKYERQHYVGSKQNNKKEQEFVDLILKAYKAQPVSGFRTFSGKKTSRLVSIGPIDLPVTRLFVEEIINECKEKQLTKVDLLAFEFEMGLAPIIIDEAKEKGINLALKHIPREVFDKRAVDAGQVVFYDVAYIEVKPIIKGNSVAVQLTDFSVYYNQDSAANVEATLQNGSNKVFVENGQIIKITRDKSGIDSREVLTKKWTDWIDYWSVDFDFESKKEIVHELRDDSPDQIKIENCHEVWTGNYIFENEWQSFRTKKDRSLELTSAFRECVKGRRKIAIKVVDIFGNDTTKVIEVNI